MSNFYAVAKGRQIGIFKTWDECKLHVDGYHGAKYKKFNTMMDAQTFIQENADRTKGSSNSENNLNGRVAMSASNHDSSVEVIEEYQPAINGQQPAHLKMALKRKAFQMSVNSIPQSLKLNPSNKKKKNKKHETVQLRDIPSDNGLATAAIEAPPPTDFKTVLQSWSTKTQESMKRFVNDVQGSLPAEISHRLVAPIQTFIMETAKVLSDLHMASSLVLLSSENTDARSGETTQRQPAREAGQKKAKKTPDEVKKSTTGFLCDERGFVHVYTDGACTNNGYHNAKAGIGVWFADGHPLNVSEPYNGTKITNNNAEIQAASYACELAKGAGIEKLCINTDSDFLIKCATVWMDVWKKRNWMTIVGNPVLNRDELEVLDRAMKNIPNLKWNHVNGHSGIHGNEAADHLAKMGAMRFNPHVNKMSS